MSDTMFDAMFGAAIAGGGSGSGFTPTETQLAAINSGIDSEKVQQIETNKTNISLLSEQVNNIPTVTNGTLTVDDDTLFTINSNSYIKQYGNVIACNIQFYTLGIISGQKTLCFISDIPILTGEIKPNIRMPIYKTNAIDIIGFATTNYNSITEKLLISILPKPGADIPVSSMGYWFNFSTIIG